MRYYRQIGDVPRHPHTQMVFKERLAGEEVRGYEGFSGQHSRLMRTGPPQAITKMDSGPEDVKTVVREAVHQQGHIQAFKLGSAGDVITGRTWLLVNNDVQIAVVAPSQPQTTLYANGSSDELLFLHHGSGVVHSEYGRFTVRQGDYIVIPHGTFYLLELDDPATSRLLVVEARGMIDSPSRYRAGSQLLEDAPYSERSVRGPESLEYTEGPCEVWVKNGGRITVYHRDHHPFNVIGWDGYAYPYAFSIHDFIPRAARLHPSPHTHQTFEAPGFVICSFVPRQVDWDPAAVPLPYNHLNLQSDEVLYYAGEYPARRGIVDGSLTHHVQGLTHGPQPGAAEAALTKPRTTTELAVMIDTFSPLGRTAAALALLDAGYPFSWHVQSEIGGV